MKTSVSVIWIVAIVVASFRWEGGLFFTMGSQRPENSSSNVPKVASKPYGKIELSLNNVLLPETKLKTTPSVLDGMDIDTETDLRILGCELIQTAGILLKLPQVSMFLYFSLVGVFNFSGIKLYFLFR